MRMRADRKRESRAVNGARSVDSKVQFAFFTTVGQIRSRPQVSGRGIHPSRRASTDPSSAMSRVTNATMFAVAAALPQCISDRRFQDCNDDNNSDRKKCSGQCRRPPVRVRPSLAPYAFPSVIFRQPATIQHRYQTMDKANHGRRERGGGGQSTALHSLSPSDRPADRAEGLT